LVVPRNRSASSGIELLDGYADALVLRQHLSPGTGREELEQIAEDGDREVETHGSLLAAD